MHGKSALLIIGGGIAAYKSLELIRRLREREFQVRVILTRAGSEFVTPLSVAALVLENGGDEDEAIAALLHDAAEDCGGRATLDEIRRRFGPRVADIVDGCTDSYETPKPAWRPRKEGYLAKLHGASPSVRLVSAADKLHNARSVLADFRPLSRFATVAMALSLPFAWSAALWLAGWGGPRLLRATVALAACVLLATPAALAFASYGRNGGAAEWARPVSPISSVPPGIAQAARFLREHADPGDVVMLDGVWDYLDIPLAFESGLPESRLVRRAWDNFEERLTQTPPTMAVLIYQGRLQTTFGAAGAVETADRFEFRGTPFCAEAKFVYASIYRRCAGAEAAKILSR